MHPRRARVYDRLERLGCNGHSICLPLVLTRVRPACYTQERADLFDL